MSHSHAKDEPIVEAEVLPPDAEEDDEVRDPRLFQLFLDSDGRYRWYEEDAETDVNATTLLEVLQEAEGAWDGFQVVEIRGEPVVPGTDIKDAYAVDELEGIEEE